jgi:hypothetical protein
VARLTRACLLGGERRSRKHGDANEDESTHLQLRLRLK